MLFTIFFFICFFSSVIGAICGIGGGVIIKPVLDAFHVLDVATISFLSGCTVLSMTTYSVFKSKQSRKSHIEQKTGFPLALGAAAGGLLGKWLFSFILSLSSDIDKVGAVQSTCLLIVTIMLFKVFTTFLNCRICLKENISTNSKSFILHKLSLDIT